MTTSWLINLALFFITFAVVIALNHATLPQHITTQPGEN